MWVISSWHLLDYHVLHEYVPLFVVTYANDLKKVMSGTTPMGSQDPLRFGGEEDCTKRRSKRSMHKGIFTQVRATQMHKTVLLLDCIICVLGQVLGALP